uniref:CLIP-associated protein n=1 Tax=Rhizophora mucronata TaxID=61149 RepID=A0A2P2QRC6_RHIMU
MRIGYHRPEQVPPLIPTMTRLVCLGRECGLRTSALSLSCILYISCEYIVRVSSFCLVCSCSF